MTSKVSPAAVPTPDGVDAVDADLLDLAQFRDDVGEGCAVAGDDDLRWLR